jgi:predicted acylesterase/phospholipase RssA
MPIKHIVLEGGAYLGISTLGALSMLQKEEFYDIEQIQTIYGSSIGAVIGGLLCLKLEWADLLEYIRDRPWYKILKFSPDQLFTMTANKGIFDSSFFYKTFNNLLQSKDLNNDISMKELYEYSQIELHIITTKLNDFTIVDISHKTHPDFKFIQAVYQSSTIPILFQPNWYETSYFLDGGLLNNYPIDLCIKNGAQAEEILGVRYNALKASGTLGKGDGFLDYLLHLFRKLFSVQRKGYEVNLENQLIIPCDTINLAECQKLLQDSSLRAKYLIDGEKAAQTFLFYQKK